MEDRVHVVKDILRPEGLSKIAFPILNKAHFELIREIISEWFCEVGATTTRSISRSIFDEEADLLWIWIEVEWKEVISTSTVEIKFSNVARTKQNIPLILLDNLSCSANRNTYI